MKNVLFAALLFWTVATSPAEADSAATNLRVVEGLIDAFNAQDIDAMGRFLAEDVVWINVAGESVAVESRGEEALLAMMATYFKGCPTCRSSLSHAISTPGRVSAVETASWSSEGIEQSQSAVSVYELADGEIKRIYYFPAEK